MATKKKVIPPPPPPRTGSTLTLRLDPDEKELLEQLQDKLNIKAGTRALIEAARIILGDYQEKKAEVRVLLHQKEKLESTITNYIDACNDARDAATIQAEIFNSLRQLTGNQDTDEPLSIVTTKGIEYPWPTKCPQCGEEFNDFEIEEMQCLSCGWELKK